MAIRFAELRRRAYARSWFGCREYDVLERIGTERRTHNNPIAWSPLFLLVNAPLSFAGLSQCQTVAVAAGQDGAAQITLAEGKKTRIQKERGQVGISSAHTASDGTVGWLAEYSVEGVSYPIAGTLIIWRSGKTIRRFPTEQFFYTWTFYAGSKQVSYHVNPGATGQLGQEA